MGRLSLIELGWWAQPVRVVKDAGAANNYGVQIVRHRVSIVLDRTSVRLV
jgi:hypothetical protein